MSGMIRFFGLYLYVGQKAWYPYRGRKIVFRKEAKACDLGFEETEIRFSQAVSVEILGA
jgi:hypothetical protein